MIRIAEKTGSGAGGELLFVVEHSLGHAVHGANLAAAVARQPELRASVARLGRDVPVPESRLPLLRTWSFRASRATQTALRDREAKRCLRGLFIHTQAASLLAGGVMSAVPTVVSMDATPLGYDSIGAGYDHRRQSQLPEWAKWRIHRRVFLKARALVAWSRWAARSLVDEYLMPTEMVHVIHPGVDLERFSGPAARGHPGPVRLLFVGGDFVRKGGEDLIEAARQLGQDVELDIVTAARPLATLRGVPARVHTGLGNDSQLLQQLYRRADIFVLPSRAECFGIAISEAMASGLPVVACGVGGVPDMVADGRTGLLVSPGDVPGLVHAIRTLVELPDLRRAMGDSGLRAARMEHDATRNCRAVVDLVRCVADEGTGVGGQTSGTDARHGQGVGAR